MPVERKASKVQTIARPSSTRQSLAHFIDPSQIAHKVGAHTSGGYEGGKVKSPVLRSAAHRKLVGLEATVAPGEVLEGLKESPHTSHGAKRLI